MPIRDLYHHNVVHALQNDGWKITHDPLILKIGKKCLFADIGADRLLSATKGTEKIAVEVKTFLGRSDVYELQHAFGQFMMYHKILKYLKSDRHLYLAITKDTFDGIFSQEIGKLFLNDCDFNLIVFDEEEESIIQWV